MDNMRIKKTRFIPIWQEEKEIKWLEDMSLSGWHLVKKGYITYWFEKGESKEYAYRYDFKLTASKDYDEYRQIFKESGWQLVGEFANWHYFRSDKAEGSIDIYSDVSSNRMRFRRILIMMIVLAFINLTLLVYNIFVDSLVVDNIKDVHIVLLIVWILISIVILLLIYSAFRIGIKIHRLKNSISE